MSKNKRFQRTSLDLPYRKLFVIATEGKKTEPQYFAMFKYHSAIDIQLLKHDASDPLSVLKQMKVYLNKARLKPDDEAWLVVDKDNWTREQLNRLYAWAQMCCNYGLAVSNPNFEYWLLLHFEDGTAEINSGRKCMDRLKRHLPQYDKGVCHRDFKDEQIGEAIKRARQRHNSSCSNYPLTFPGSTVYKLVENIRTGLESQKSPAPRN